MLALVAAQNSPQLLVSKTKKMHYDQKLNKLYYSKYYFQYGSQCFVTHKVIAAINGRNLVHSGPPPTQQTHTHTKNPRPSKNKYYQTIADMCIKTLY